VIPTPGLHRQVWAIATLSGPLQALSLLVSSSTQPGSAQASVNFSAQVSVKVLGQVNPDFFEFEAQIELGRNPECLCEDVNPK